MIFTPIIKYKLVTIFQIMVFHDFINRSVLFSKFRVKKCVTKLGDVKAQKAII
jgi:hypothetical protein